MSVTIKVRRDTAANWTSANPVLSAGEPGYETDTKSLKIGDGSTAWNSLSYYAGGVGFAWQNFAAATTGVTSPTTVARYAVVGNTCFIALTLSGTSNATTKTITLPITPANISGMQWIFPVTVKDNGAVLTTPGEIVVNPANATASIYKNTAAGAWTASGTWFAIGNGFYEI